MGRFKVKKQDTFIDMTPMSDVMVLLLTFFMLTATFVKQEPVKVVTPGSVSDIKIPEKNLLTIYVETNGKVFMTMASPDDLSKWIDQMTDPSSESGLKLTAAQKKAFTKAPTFGSPISTIPMWLSANDSKRDELLNSKSNPGIPTDSVGNEFKIWIKAARTACPDMRIAIKADKATPYAVIKRVMDSLRDLDENRYNLITSLKGGKNN